MLGHQFRGLVVGLRKTSPAQNGDPKVREIAAKRVTDPLLAAEVAAAEKERVAAKQRMRDSVPEVVWDYLAGQKMPGWSLSKEDTEVVSVNDRANGEVEFILSALFKGGNGEGIRFDSGAQMHFGPTITAESPLPMYGLLVFPYNGSTCMLVGVSFSLVHDGGNWRISSMHPSSLPVPQFSPM